MNRIRSKSSRGCDRRAGLLWIIAVCVLLSQSAAEAAPYVEFRGKQYDDTTQPQVMLMEMTGVSVDSRPSREFAQTRYQSITGNMVAIYVAEVAKAEKLRPTTILNEKQYTEQQWPDMKRVWTSARNELVAKQKVLKEFQSGGMTPKDFYDANINKDDFKVLFPIVDLFEIFVSQYESSRSIEKEIAAAPITPKQGYAAYRRQAELQSIADAWTTKTLAELNPTLLSLIDETTLALALARKDLGDNNTSGVISQELLDRAKSEQKIILKNVRRRIALQRLLPELNFPNEIYKKEFMEFYEGEMKGDVLPFRADELKQ